MNDETLALELRTVSGAILDELLGCGHIAFHNTNEGVVGIASCNDINFENSYFRVYSLPGSLPSGMAENGNGELLAFPNPSKSFINIPTSGPGHIDVFNTQGQKVLEVLTTTQGYQQVPTKALPPGTYIYQTRTNDEVQPGKKFVVYLEMRQ